MRIKIVPAILYEKAPVVDGSMKVRAGSDKEAECAGNFLVVDDLVPRMMGRDCLDPAQTELLEGKNNPILPE